MRAVLVHSTEYSVTHLTTGEVQIEERFGSNIRWFNSRSEFSNWLRYQRRGR